MAKENSKEESGKVASSFTDLEELANIILGKTNPSLAGGKPHPVMSDEQMAAVKKKTPKEIAEDFWIATDLKYFTFPGIHVTSDGQIFHGNLQGENSLANHIASSVVNGVPTITYESFKKPE